ncbi:VOC family protein [Winogradskyella sp.]|uniref:VOC family protein n=1 Tax=Winogradskyella sp. TaxID=1883156 RepID=UPI002633DDDB|nr:VOC family protein [Winogradskyella sp.]
MKNTILLYFLVLTYFGFAQEKSLPHPEAYFSAIVVEDIDISINWCKKNLGFKTINKYESENKQLRQVNIVCGDILIELIELKSSVTANELLKDQPKKTFINGFFKIGFLLDEFDTRVEHLKKLGVQFHGTIVIDKHLGKEMVIIKDPDGNRVELFEK